MNTIRLGQPEIYSIALGLVWIAFGVTLVMGTCRRRQSTQVPHVPLTKD